MRLKKRAFFQRLIYWMPGLDSLLSYKKRYFYADLRAGLSVAAVSLPVSIAYAQLTGVSAIAGLYSSILPMIVYALFGSSRQLIVGPDTATCAVIAAAVAPVAMNNEVLRWQLVVVITLMIGIWCMIAARLRLGALADLLSHPILMGLLNGISITIILDQFAKACGFSFAHATFIGRVMELPERMPNFHLLTAMISFATLVMLVIIRKLRPRWPAPLIAVAIMTFLSWFFNYGSDGVALIGSISTDGILLSSWLTFDIGLFPELVVPSINIAIICFVSAIITARTFAAKNNYDINTDIEFRALGVANIAAALSQGFVVSGTSSRTAVNDAYGGKTQLVSVISALAIAVVVFFFLPLLRYIPVGVLGVILIFASWPLIDFHSIFKYLNRNRDAFYLSLSTFIAVLGVGIISGMGLAVILGLLIFLRKIFRPTEQILGLGNDGYIHSIGGETKPVPNVLIYRFNSPLTYFNIGFFKRRLLSFIDKTPGGYKWIIVDAVPSFTYPDVSVMTGVAELIQALKLRDCVLVLAGRRGTLRRWFKDMRIDLDKEHVEFSPDLYLAVRMVQSKDHVNKQGNSYN